MAIGDEAVAAGFSLVPETGEEGRVRWGSRELNKTRDYIAQIKKLIPGSKGAARNAAGITTGTNVPSNATGADGDIHFRII